MEKKQSKEIIYTEQYRQKIHFFYMLLSGTGILFLAILYFIVDEPINMVALTLFFSYPIYRFFVTAKRIDFFELYTVKILIKSLNIFKKAHKKFYKGK